jgi:hypothetical protein
MASTRKKLADWTIVVRATANGKSFDHYTLPDGKEGKTVRVMDSKFLGEAIRRSDQSIRTTVEEIRERRGAAVVNE